MIRDSHIPIFLINLTSLAVVAVSCSSMEYSPASSQGPTTRLACSLVISKAGASSIGADSANVFVYEDHPPFRLDSYVKVPLDGSAIDVGSTSGNKILAVLANVPDRLLPYDKICSFESLSCAMMDLAVEDPKLPAMSGISRFLARGGAKAEVRLKPLLCRIAIKSLTVNLSSRPYSGKTLTVNRAYLTGVSGRCRIVEGNDSCVTEFLNCERFDPVATAALAHPELLVSESFDNASMFCYPNSSLESFGAYRTKLVLEAEMEGVTYYYPISLENLVRGNSYEYDIVITRTGCTDPDSPAEPEDVDIVCSIREWKDYDTEIIDY